MTIFTCTCESQAHGNLVTSESMDDETGTFSRAHLLTKSKRNYYPQKIRQL